VKATQELEKLQNLDQVDDTIIENLRNEITKASNFIHDGTEKINKINQELAESQPTNEGYKKYIRERCDKEEKQYKLEILDKKKALEAKYNQNINKQLNEININDADVYTIDEDFKILSAKIENFKNSSKNIKCGEKIVNKYNIITLPYKDNYFIARCERGEYLPANIVGLTDLIYSPHLNNTLPDDDRSFKNLLHQGYNANLGFSTQEKCYVPVKPVAAIDKTFYTHTPDNALYIKKCIVMRIYEQLAPLLYLSEYVTATHREKIGEENFIEYLHNKVTRWQLQSHHLQIHHLMSFYVKCAFPHSDNYNRDTQSSSSSSSSSSSTPQNIEKHALGVEDFINKDEYMDRLFEEVHREYINSIEFRKLSKLEKLNNQNIKNMCAVLTANTEIDMARLAIINIEVLKNDKNEGNIVPNLFYNAIENKLAYNQEITLQQLYSEIETQAAKKNIDKNNYYLRTLRSCLELNARELEMLETLKKIVNNKITFDLHSQYDVIKDASIFMRDIHFDQKKRNIKIKLSQEKIQNYVETYFSHDFNNIAWDLNSDENFYEFVCSYYSIVNFVIECFNYMHYTPDNNNVEEYVNDNRMRAAEKISKFTCDNIHKYTTLHLDRSRLEHYHRSVLTDLTGVFERNMFIPPQVEGQPRNKRQNRGNDHYKARGGYSEYKNKYFRLKNELKDYKK
jgi:hypothetical protein